ncbi:YczE/YyaS/YitT family protein [Helcococcus kunzii]|uniref:YczE/YyaS/YitT family protein n=1 Tax=Helcococcus kunzii TaxID=40091 RepID=UPI0024ADFA11|nr:YitT family protein [Helcococcus kunzii]
MNKTNINFKYVCRFIDLIIGLLIMSFGISLFIKADLGANPLTTFTQGISIISWISVGKSSQLLMIVTLFFVFVFDKKRIGVGTFVNAILTGVFIDFFMKMSINVSDLFFRVLFLTLAIVFFSVGLAIYVSSEFGEGAVDAFMIIIRDKLNISLKHSRIILDAILVILGKLCGSRIGIGTILSILLTGPIMVQTMKVKKGEK